MLDPFCTAPDSLPPRLAGGYPPEENPANVAGVCSAPGGPVHTDWVYSDGSQHPLLSAGFQGSNGTWPFSNPLVMSVNQQGLASATTWGTTIIRYTSPSGVNFSEWLKYITAQ